MKRGVVFRLKHLYSVIFAPRARPWRCALTASALLLRNLHPETWAPGEQEHGAERWGYGVMLRCSGTIFDMLSLQRLTIGLQTRWTGIDHLHTPGICFEMIEKLFEVSSLHLLSGLLVR